MSAKPTNGGGPIGRARADALRRQLRSPEFDGVMPLNGTNCRLLAAAPGSTEAGCTAPPTSWSNGREDRVLATVLFTDIVNSTFRAAEAGDRRWRELLDAHDETALHEVERFRGRRVKTLGDGMLAVFEGLRAASTVPRLSATPPPSSVSTRKQHSRRAGSGVPVPGR